MYRALVGIGLLCALVIVSVFQITQPAIHEKMAAALDKAVFNVLPGARYKVEFQLINGAHFEQAAAAMQSDQVVYAGYDEHKHLIGIAVEAQGMGYQDVINLLYGYAPDQQAIIGMQVLDSRETPGLGDRIKKDPMFLRNFQRLDVALAANKQSIANPVKAVKSGTKTEPWEIDSITGATVSSNAVAAIVRQSTNKWVPLIHQHLEEFNLGNEDIK